MLKYKGIFTYNTQYDNSNVHLIQVIFIDKQTMSNCEILKTLNTVLMFGYFDNVPTALFIYFSFVL